MCFEHQDITVTDCGLQITEQAPVGREEWQFNTNVQDVVLFLPR